MAEKEKNVNQSDADSKKNKGKYKEEEQEEEKESVGSKIALVIVALLIILIWLAIIAVAIKADIGGFGSSVLYPLLKDVPYVNMILPDVEEETEEDTQYQYGSLDNAIERIKELELELQQVSDSNAESQQTIEELQSQVDELSQYKEEQDTFEAEKEKFYEEVVFSDEAPDIEEYRSYYESIDPENAQVLYKQVVEQTVQDEKIEEYVKTYSSMKPKSAASIFDSMNDLNLVAEILENMDTQSRADILSNMSADNAAKLTQIMEPQN